LCENGGYTQREVGELLKIGNGASVSKQIKKASNLLATDKAVQKLQNTIRNRLLKLKERADP